MQVDLKEAVTWTDIVFFQFDIQITWQNKIKNNFKFSNKLTSQTYLHLVWMID